MNCDIIKDLLPLYMDDCCSNESRTALEKHIALCSSCKNLLDDMGAHSDAFEIPQAPKVFQKLRGWKASVLQSILLFISFACITVGVAMEAKTPSGLANGFWARNLVVPATGFMLSLANWYFISIYKNKKLFSRCSFVATLAITLSAYVWCGFHYQVSLADLFSGKDFSGVLETLHALLLYDGIGILLTIAFCVLSKILSGWYANMLGKE